MEASKDFTAFSDRELNRTSGSILKGEQFHITDFGEGFAALQKRNGETVYIQRRLVDPRSLGFALWDSVPLASSETANKSKTPTVAPTSGRDQVVSPKSAGKQKIVVVADSHGLGDFGRNLAKELSDHGKNEVVVIAAGGLSWQHFLNGFTPSKPANNCKKFSATDFTKKLCGGTGRIPSIDEIMADENPDLIVPALGSNNSALNGIKGRDDKLTPFADKIRARVASAGMKCSWIGPPEFNSSTGMCRFKGKMPEVESRIETAISGACKYVSSHDHTRGPTHSGDCLHRAGTAAEEWATGVTPGVLDTGPAPMMRERRGQR